MVYSNEASPAGRLLVVRADNVGFSQDALNVSQDGTGTGISIAQANVASGGAGGSGLVITSDSGGGSNSVHGLSVNLTGTGNANSSAANFVSSNTAASTVQISGTETGRGTLKITHTGTGSDTNSSAISIDLAGSGTAAQGIFLDATGGGTTGKLLNLRNNGTELLTLDATGQLGLGTSGTNTATLDVRGTGLIKTTSATAFKVQDASSNKYILVDTSGASLALGNTGIASTIQVGNTTGAVAQTINIGNNATGGSTTNVNIGSSVAGTVTVNSALTLVTGKTLTVNGDAFTDLTGNGLQDSSNALSILLTSSGTTGSTASNSGLEVGTGGLTLLKGCADNEILKYTDAGGWACAADGTGSGITIGTIDTPSKSADVGIKSASLYSLELPTILILV